MSDRVQSALRGLGIEGTPVAALEREDAFFALLGDLLVYQDEQGTRRVTLRDLTRIHSDQGGLLRVETPAGTALTASLLGFDPARVQPFFAQVRDATARAKNMPAAPLPTPGGLKTFGSGLKTSRPQGAADAGAAPTETAGKPTARPEVNLEKGETKAGPEKAAPTVWGGLPPTRTTAQPEPRPEARVVAVTASPTPAPMTPVEPQKPSIQPAPVASKSDAKQKAPARPLDLLPALAERANAVHGLVGRLRLLAVVLGLAAVGLAVIQYLEADPFGGLWTLIAGGVGSVALLIFADVTRLIVALARAVAEGRGAEAETATPARND